ncbi:hypothetical protein B0T25DRAFT_231284 [Lasiosphaeria hispida]|uniref:Uncharacterized protein n=1 Tax=Lasiosphaeria hispida TaxID=260671 RepID=A0AAJ0HE24_9PEZI|nr:hypothetical protein B0T25DRAFT_231284 [Lasiosphaeria hispida]
MDKSGKWPRMVSGHALLRRLSDAFLLWVPLVIALGVHSFSCGICHPSSWQIHFPVGNLATMPDILSLMWPTSTYRKKDASSSPFSRR